jgi:hypothetical protein
MTDKNNRGLGVIDQPAELTRSVPQVVTGQGLGGS